jgi:hypothetical protein
VGLDHWIGLFKSSLIKMEQMMEFLKAMEAKMETQIGSLASVMNAIEHERRAHHEEMMAKMDAWRGVT